MYFRGVVCNWANLLVSLWKNLLFNERRSASVCFMRLGLLRGGRDSLLVCCPPEWLINTFNVPGSASCAGAPVAWIVEDEIQGIEAANRGELQALLGAAEA